MAGLFGQKIRDFVQSQKGADYFGALSRGENFGAAMDTANQLARQRILDEQALKRQQGIDAMDMQYKQAQIDAAGRVKPVETWKPVTLPDGRTVQMSNRGEMKSMPTSPALKASPTRQFSLGDGMVVDQRMVGPGQYENVGEPYARYKPTAPIVPKTRTYNLDYGGKQQQVWDANTNSWVDEGEPVYPRPTADEGKAYGFAKRMNNAMRAMMEVDPLGGVSSDAGMSLLSGVWGGNYMVSPAYQQAMQAKRDLVNAILRRESGAVIRDDEFANADLQYFPVRGDSDAVIKQKRRNLLDQYESMRYSAGRKGQELPTRQEMNDFFDKMVSQAQTSEPTDEEILNMSDEDYKAYKNRLIGN